MSYQGEFWGLTPHGSGRATFTNGSCVDGSFEMGVLVAGRIQLADGSEYTGPCVDAVPMGRGTATLPDGTLLDGEFLDGQIIHGTALLPNGREYEGEFKDFVPHGKGRRDYGHGCEYDGEWCNGYPEGEGRYVVKGCVEHIGCFDRNGPSGPGRVIDRARRLTVAGDFVGWYRVRGEGSLSLDDELHYEGKMLDSQPCGHGTMSYAGFRITADFRGDKIESDFGMIFSICASGISRSIE